MWFAVRETDVASPLSASTTIHELNGLFTYKMHTGCYAPGHQQSISHCDVKQYLEQRQETGVCMDLLIRALLISGINNQPQLAA